MMNLDRDRKVQLKIRQVFPAAPARVFRAWTDPADLKRWWAVEAGWRTPVAEVDLRVGGRYRLGMQPPDGEEIYLVQGEYREIIPDRLLVYTWRWDTDSAEVADTLVRVEFRPVAAGTEVVLVHEALPDEASRDRHLEGWQGCLRGLAHLLSEQSLGGGP